MPLFLPYPFPEIFFGDGYGMTIINKLDCRIVSMSDFVYEQVIITCEDMIMC